MKLLIVVTFILDQLAKHWVNKELIPGEKRKPFSKLVITNVKNEGMAFGAFSDNRPLVLVLSAFGIISLWHMYKQSSSGAEKLGAALIAGGGLSNIYDRATKGCVTDYVYIESKRNTPVFNLADIFIIIGCLIAFISRIGKKHG